MKMIINNKQWAYFQFNDIFEHQRGSRYRKQDHATGDIAYISSTKKNNGIDNYVSPPPKMKIYQNAITLNNSGSVGYCFYHPYPFVCSDHCTVIDIKDKNIQLNMTKALFLKPILEAIKPKYNFAREISDKRLSKEKILLPTRQNGTPDWSYMDSYIRNISTEIKYSNTSGKNGKKTLHHQIDISTWKSYTYQELFDVKKGKRLTKADITAGETPFIAATEFNNGYRQFIEETPIHEGNTITVNYNGSVGKAFYQAQPFWASDDVNVLYPRFSLNIYIAMFIIPLIEVERFRFSFGRKWNSERMKRSTIKLPTKNGMPNFEFMENYIKSLPYSTSLK